MPYCQFLPYNVLGGLLGAANNQSLWIKKNLQFTIVTMNPLVGLCRGSSPFYRKES
jgi:hypothetical protein